MRIAGIVNDSIVDGPGLRYTIFSQGCSHNCPGCHNPETHSFDGGFEIDTESIISEISKNPLLSGVTFSGGDPIEQPAPFLELAKAIKKMELNIWMYTGYTYEELTSMHNPIIQELLSYVDVIVDGPYIESKRQLDLEFRGSSNQRIIKREK